LTEAVSPPELEEEPIDLVYAVEEDEVIDLTETAESSEMGGEPIDLLEAVGEKEAFEDTETFPASGEVDEELIELVEEINRDTKIDIKEEETLSSDEDLLEPDDEIDIPGEEVSEMGREIESRFAESLDIDLDSALATSEEDLPDEQETTTRLDTKGVMTVKVRDKRKAGAPIAFKFESIIRPGDTIVREEKIGQGPEIEVSQEQVEEVVEKVVREMLSKKIERLLPVKRNR
jgi:hypothetical protein